MPDAVAAWLSLGSNLGDRAATIAAALERVDRLPGTRILARSALYGTAPWGGIDQGPFLNAAAAIATTLPPHGLLEACLGIERDLGRVRGRRWGPRVIDIDLIHVDGVALADDRLRLPHPLWRERAFVLVPLAEIASDLTVDGTAVRDALEAVDTTGVQPWNEAVPMGRPVC